MNKRKSADDCTIVLTEQEAKAKAVGPRGLRSYREYECVYATMAMDLFERGYRPSGAVAELIGQLWNGQQTVAMTSDEKEKLFVLAELIRCDNELGVFRVTNQLMTVLSTGDPASTFSVKPHVLASKRTPRMFDVWLRALRLWPIVSHLDMALVYRLAGHRVRISEDKPRLQYDDDGSELHHLLRVCPYNADDRDRRIMFFRLANRIKHFYAYGGVSVSYDGWRLGLFPVTKAMSPLLFHESCKVDFVSRLAQMSIEQETADVLTHGYNVTRQSVLSVLHATLTDWLPVVVLYGIVAEYLVRPLPKLTILVINPSERESSSSSSSDGSENETVGDAGKTRAGKPRATAESRGPTRQ